MFIFDASMQVTGVVSKLFAGLGGFSPNLGFLWCSRGRLGDKNVWGKVKVFLALGDAKFFIYDVL